MVGEGGVGLQITKGHNPVMSIHFTSETRDFSTTNQVPEDWEGPRDGQRPAQGHMTWSTCLKKIEAEGTLLYFSKRSKWQ